MRDSLGLIAVLSVACIPQSKTVLVAPTRDAQTTLTQVQERARQLKLRAIPTQRDGELLRYWGNAEYSEADHSGPVDVSIRTDRAGDTGVVVATGSGDQAALRTLLPEGIRYEDAAQPLGTVAFDLGAEAGWARGPGGGGWRVDAGGHLGWRFGARPRARGELQPEPKARATLAVLGGLGLAMQEDRAAVRVAITASGAVQTLARPLPGRVLAGRALALDLSASVLSGLDADWKAIEAGAAVHLAGWGGPFVRGGREWGARGDGNTWMAGVKVGHEGIVHLAMAAVVTYVVGYAIANWPSADKNLP